MAYICYTNVCIDPSLGGSSFLLADCVILYSVYTYVLKCRQANIFSFLGITTLCLVLLQSQVDVNNLHEI